jgi:hypothetical protein
MRWNDGVRIAGRPEPPAKEETSAGWARVMPGFFETIGAKMAMGRPIMGRPITEDDTATTRPVAVINEAFARRFFKNENPLGKHFGPDKIQYASKDEIVGVVKDMRYMTYDYKDPGANRGRVLRMVLRGAFSQVAIGLAIGIPAAIGAGKLMTQQLFSVRPWDPVMLASATLALGLAALLASALPAWRAAGVEPMVALRNE